MNHSDDLQSLLEDINDKPGWATCLFRLTATDEIAGMASYLATDVANGVTEVGFVAHGPSMARSPASTEAHYLLARHALETLVYRRYK